MFKKHQSQNLEKQENDVKKALDILTKNFLQEWGHSFVYANKRTGEDEIGVETIIHIKGKKYELELRPCDEVAYEFASSKVAGKTISTKLH